MDNDGQWVYDQGKFRAEEMGHVDQEGHSFFNLPDERFQKMLNLDVSIENVKGAFFEMGPYKAPGLDGFQPIFFQHQWETIGQDLYSFVKGVFDGVERC